MLVVVPRQLVYCVLNHAHGLKEVGNRGVLRTLFWG